MCDQPSVSCELSRVGNVYNMPGHLGQEEINLTDYEANNLTHIRGIVLVKKSDNRYYLAIDISSISNTVGDTLPLIAHHTNLTQKQVFESIVRFRSNAGVRRFLYNKIEHKSGLSSGSIAAKLRRHGEREEYRQVTGEPQKFYRAYGYQDWKLFRYTGAPLVLPLSPAFEEKIKKHRLKVLRERFKDDFVSELLPYIERFDSLADEIKRKVIVRRDKMEPFMQELSTLDTVSNLVNIMADHPAQGYNPSADSKATARGFAANVGAVRERAAHDFFTGAVAPASTAATSYSLQSKEMKRIRRLGQEYNRLGTTLRELMESKKLVALVHKIIRNDLLVTDRTIHQFSDACARAIQALMLTDERQYVLDKWAVPIFTYLSGFEDQSPTIIVPEFAKPTVITPLMYGRNALPMVAGNMPGPQSFMVAFLEAVGPSFVGYVLKDPTQKATIGRGFSTLFQAVTGMADDELREVQKLVKSGSTQRVRDGQALLSSKFQNSAGFSGFLAILNLWMLVEAVQNNPLDSISNFASLIASLSGTATSIAQFAAALKGFEYSAKICKLTMPEILGVIGAIAGIVICTDSAIRRYSYSKIICHNMVYDLPITIS